MRRAPALLLTLALAAGAAACGDGTPAPTGSTTGSADDAGTFPVTIEHAYGETVVPARPERVVTVGYNDQDPVLAIGVVPVGVMEWYEDDPLGFFWTLEAYGGAEPALVNGAEFLEIDFEAVAALRPDLVVGISGLPEDAYELLSRIAPTIAQPPGEGDYSSAPWQDVQRIVGRALGREDEAEAAIAAVEDGIAAARAEHPELEGATAMVVQVYEGQYAVRGRDEVWSEFLQALGFEIPDFVPDDYLDVSEEAIEEWGDVDALVWLATPDEVTSPIYPGLRVAAEGRDVFVESLGELSGAIGFNSAISLPVVLERLVPRLAAALDGDPATVVEVAE